MNIQLLTAVISASVALTIGIMTFVHNRRTLRESRIAERRKALDKGLNEFYGPLYYNLAVIKGLYKLFSAGKPKGFRTLTYLLNPGQEYESEAGKEKVMLSDSDKRLLEEIISISEEVERLIVSKGGLVDDPVLTFNYVPDPSVTDVNAKIFKGLGLFMVAVTHFRVLRLAYRGGITGEVDRYKDFVYPRELDGKLYDKIAELQRELKVLGG